MLDKNFKDIISNIKEEIINTQIKTMQEVNSNLIMLYFKLGKNRFRKQAIWKYFYEASVNRT